METNYTVNDDVEVYIDERYNVKVNVKNYVFNYHSTSFSAQAGWQLDLNDGLKYAVQTKEMTNDLLKFLATSCAPPRIKKLKNSLVCDYYAFTDMLHNFMQDDDELSIFDTHAIMYGVDTCVTELIKVEVQVLSKSFLNCWGAYLRYRRYGTSDPKMVDNYFFNKINVSFIRVTEDNYNG